MESLSRRYPASVRGALFAAILLVGLTAAAYGPAARGGFLWDDDFYVQNLGVLRSAEGLGRIWLEPGATPQYYPFVFSTFWIEYHLWGLDARGYHVVNIGLHILAALLLGRALRRLGVPGARLAALVFALHPVHVESVAWISERKNVLSTVSYLLSALAYLRFAGLDGNAAGGSGQAPPARRRDYAASLLLYAAALLSKTVTCTLPAALLLLVGWKRGRVTGRDVRNLLPFFVLGLALAAMTIWVEQRHVGARLLDFGLSVPDRVVLAGRVVGFYLGKLLWPSPLVFVYPRWVIDSGRAAAWLPPAGVAAVVAVLAWQRRRIGAGPLVAALFFVGTLLPALGFVDVLPMRYSWVADHFQYLASLGPIAGLAALAARIGGTVRDRWPRGGRLVALGVAGVLVALLAGATRHQAHVYRDVETLWLDTLAKNPNATMAHINLGNLHAARGESAAAIASYRQVFEVEPPERDTILLARAHYNLGNELGRRAEFGEALAEFDAALATDSRYVNAHYGRGTALIRLGRPEEARAAFEAALAIDPAHRDARQGLEWLRARGRSGLPGK